MVRKKRVDASKERFWRRMVQLWRKSGLTVRSFCRLHDLSEPSWYAWRRTLAQRDARAIPFQPVKIVSEPATASDGDGDARGLELVLPRGRRLRIGAGFDAGTLRRLLAVLEEQPC